MSVSCRYSFVIPLSGASAELAARALDQVRDYAQFGKWQRGKRSYEQAFPHEEAVRQAGKDPNLARVSLAMFHAIWDQAESDNHLSVKHLEWECGDGLAVRSTDHSWAAPHPAAGIIQACQEELGLGAFGFKFHQDLDGETAAGAFVLAPGGKLLTLDLEDWVREQVEACNVQPGVALTP